VKSRLIHEHEGKRTFVLVFDTGDEAVEGLTTFANEHHLAAARITGIGAFRDVILGYFDWPSRKYQRIPVNEQVEVLALIGDIALKDGKSAVHAHVVVGRFDGSTRGGHLIEAHVRPTLEVVIDESPAHLQKRHDPESGLALIEL
jgi:predicted DNA-binding protein with PD1-like motif